MTAGRVRRVPYRGHTIETTMISGAGLWSVSVYRNAGEHNAREHPVWSEAGGYSRHAAAVRDARYMIDCAIKDAGEAR